MAPTRKGGEKCHSDITKVVSRECTINTHKYIGEWASRSKPFRHSKRSGNLPSKRWEGQVCTLTPGSAKLSGRAKGVKKCPPRYPPVTVQKTRGWSHQTSSLRWLPVYLSSLSKTYRQCKWEPTADIVSHKTERRKVEKERASESAYYPENTVTLLIIFSWTISPIFL